jgi:hypothetical protein
MKKQKKIPQAGPKSANVPQKLSKGTWILRNIFLLFCAVLLTKCLFSGHSSYRWTLGMLKNSTAFIRNNPSISFNEKMYVKLGKSYDYLYMIRQNTPPDAVILYPSQKAFQKKDSPFTQEIYNKMYATRFLYPRKLVQPDELQTNEYANQINYVAIVNGVGANYLPYPVDSTLQTAVLPIKRMK